MKPPTTEPIKLTRCYSIALTGWLALTLASFAFVFLKSRDAVETEFQREAETTFAVMREKLRANEALLSGFAGFLGVLEGRGNDEAAKIEQYAATVLDSYPSIDMLAVVRRVEHAARPATERALKAAGAPEFGLHDFNPAPGLPGLPAAKKAAYHPIVFIWPQTAAALSFLGLDIDSIPRLSEALTQTPTKRQPISSAAFPLADGEIAYAMLRAVPVRRALRAASGTHSPPDAQHAMLVLRGSALQPPLTDPETALRLQILRRDKPEAQPLYLLPAKSVARPLESRLLPLQTIEANGLGAAQALRLTLERQMRFSDISDEGLKLAALMSLLSLTLIMLYLRKHRQELGYEKNLESRAEYLALHDPLTGLPNRTLLADRVRQAVLNWRRHGNEFALIFLDLDRFKLVNEEFGHEFGDRLLSLIARRIEGVIRESDTVARYGGDEFVVVISSIAQQEDILAVGRKILAAIAQPIELDGATVVLTASAGVSCCPADGDSFDTLLNGADMAMYRVKSSGRNGLGSSERPQNPALCRSIGPLERRQPAGGVESVVG